MCNNFTSNFLIKERLEMSVIKELLRTEENGSLSFGDYELAEKTKKADFEHNGDIYKVKTYKDITRLERNDSFIYESVPGTAVTGFEMTAEGVSFQVEGSEDADITLELAEGTEYEVVVGGEVAGTIKTNLGGKLTFGVELSGGEAVNIEVKAK